MVRSYQRWREWRDVRVTVEALFITTTQPYRMASADTIRHWVKSVLATDERTRMLQPDSVIKSQVTTRMATQGHLGELVGRNRRRKTDQVAKKFYWVKRGSQSVAGVEVERTSSRDNTSDARTKSEASQGLSENERFERIGSDH